MQKKLLALLILASVLVAGCKHEEVADPAAMKGGTSTSTPDGGKDSGANLTVNPDYKGK